MDSIGGLVGSTRHARSKDAALVNSGRRSGRRTLLRTLETVLQKAFSPGALAPGSFVLPSAQVARQWANLKRTAFPPLSQVENLGSASFPLIRGCHNRQSTAKLANCGMAEQDESTVFWRYSIRRRRMLPSSWPRIGRSLSTVRAKLPASSRGGRESSVASIARAGGTWLGINQYGLVAVAANCMKMQVPGGAPVPAACYSAANCSVFARPSRLRSMRPRNWPPTSMPA